MNDQNNEPTNRNAVDELLSNSDSVNEAPAAESAAPAKKSKRKKAAEDTTVQLEDDSHKLFRRFKIKDIVFLAIMSTIMLVTGAVMPIIGQIPLFGIVQLGLGLQFSIFPAIGMMKVRKPFALTLMATFCGVLLLFMNTVMFFVMIICALIAETLTLLIFHSYEKKGACLFAGSVFFPLSLPFLYVWYKFIYTWTGEEGEAVSAFVGTEPLIAIGMTVAVIALCFVGSLIGVLISRELRKSGVMKK